MKHNRREETWASVQGAGETGRHSVPSQPPPPLPQGRWRHLPWGYNGQKRIKVHHPDLWCWDSLYVIHYGAQRFQQPDSGLGIPAPRMPLCVRRPSRKRLTRLPRRRPPAPLCSGRETVEPPVQRGEPAVQAGVRLLVRWIQLEWHGWGGGGDSGGLAACPAVFARILRQPLHLAPRPTPRPLPT